MCFTNPMRIWGVLDVCLCLGCGSVGGVGSVNGEWVESLDHDLQWWGDVMSV